MDGSCCVFGHQDIFVLLCSAILGLKLCLNFIFLMILQLELWNLMLLPSCCLLVTLCRRTAVFCFTRPLWLLHYLLWPESAEWSSPAMSRIMSLLLSSWVLFVLISKSFITQLKYYLKEQILVFYFFPQLLLVLFLFPFLGRGGAGGLKDGVVLAHYLQRFKEDM